MSEITSIEKPEKYLLYSGGAILVLALLIGNLSSSKSAVVLKDLIVLFVTTYIAYVITKYYAGISNQAQLTDFGQSAGRRLYILSAHLRNLGEEILTFEPEGERSKIHYHNIVSQLNRLSIDTESSFQDMKQIAKLDISIPELVEEVRTTAVNNIRKEITKCPYCSTDKEILLEETIGSSRHVTCGECRKAYMVHRVGNGAIKYGIEEQYIISCPNPECSKEIRIKKLPAERGVTVRNCFDCYSRIKFDFDAGKIENWEVDPPRQVPLSAAIDGKIKCPHCSWENVVRDTANKSGNKQGKRIQFCPNCTRLLELI